eukprot:scaffold48731_cov61-Phaeocystis_antarctica.AAC.2
MFSPSEQTSSMLPPRPPLPAGEEEGEGEGEGGGGGDTGRGGGGTSGGGGVGGGDAAVASVAGLDVDAQRVEEHPVLLRPALRHLRHVVLVVVVELNQRPCALILAHLQRNDRPMPPGPCGGGRLRPWRGRHAEVRAHAASQQEQARLQRPGRHHACSP